MERTGGIPDFDGNGNLPPGVYHVSLVEIEERFTWNERRRMLFNGLKRALANLASAGVRRVWIDGSFVTAKDEPRDVDACWEYPSDMEFEALDPLLYDTLPPRRPMKLKYGVDFLIAGTPVIMMETGDFPIEEFFQFDRRLRRKGILVVDIGGHP